jgi:sugar phosphate isomerase/epimerase
MRLGLLTAPFAETPLDEVVDWTVANGFESIEIACWPRTTGPTRRYAGTSHIDVANLSADQGRDLAAGIRAKGLHISGLGFYPNPLHPDPDHRDAVIGHLKQVITAAEKMDVPFVNTFMGGDAALTTDANWERALEIWPDIGRANADRGDVVLGGQPAAGLDERIVELGPEERMIDRLGDVPLGHAAEAWIGHRGGHRMYGRSTSRARMNPRLINSSVFSKPRSSCSMMMSPS